MLVPGAPEAQAIGLERPQEEPPRPPLQTATVPFDGAHQAGTVTSAQVSLWLIAFNVKKGVNYNRLQNLTCAWMDSAHRMTAGKATRTDLESEPMRSPVNLTITVGCGEDSFTIIDREGQRPE